MFQGTNKRKKLYSKSFQYPFFHVADFIASFLTTTRFSPSSSNWINKWWRTQVSSNVWCFHTYTSFRPLSQTFSYVWFHTSSSFSCERRITTPSCERNTKARFNITSPKCFSIIFRAESIRADPRSTAITPNGSVFPTICTKIWLSRCCSLPAFIRVEPSIDSLLGSG